MKEFIGSKRVANAPLPNFVTVKNVEIFDKKEIAETFNNYFVNIAPNLGASIPESKTTFPKGKLYSLRRSLPQYHQSYRLGTGKCICQPQN